MLGMRFEVWLSPQLVVDGGEGWRGVVIGAMVLCSDGMLGMTLHALHHTASPLTTLLPLFHLTSSYKC